MFLNTCMLPGNTRSDPLEPANVARCKFLQIDFEYSHFVSELYASEPIGARTLGRCDCDIVDLDLASPSAVRHFGSA